MAVDRFAIGETGCTCNCVAGCTTSINGWVTGCHNGNVPNVTIELHDTTAGGALLSSTTTNSSGVYTFTGVSATSGDNIVIVISPTGGRFIPVNVTLTWTSGSPSSSQWGCGKTTSVNPFSAQTLSPSAGYVCDNGGCINPINKILNLTDTVYGACVLNWTSVTTWIGSKTISFPGSSSPCNTCASDSVVIQYEWDGGAAITSFTVSCQAISFCPNHTGSQSGAYANFYTTPVYICPPTMSYSFSNGAGPGAWIYPIIDNLYNCSPVSFTITE